MWEQRERVVSAFCLVLENRGAEGQGHVPGGLAHVYTCMTRRHAHQSAQCSGLTGAVFGRVCLWRHGLL